MCLSPCKQVIELASVQLNFSFCQSTCTSNVVQANSGQAALHQAQPNEPDIHHYTILL